MAIIVDSLVHSRGDDCGEENQLNTEEIAILKEISDGVFDFINEKENWSKREKELRAVINKPSGNKDIIEIRSSSYGAPHIAWGWTPDEQKRCKYLSTTLMENEDTFPNVGRMLENKIDIVLINIKDITGDYDWETICKWIKGEFEKYLENCMIFRIFNNTSEVEEVLQEILNEQNERKPGWDDKEEEIICRSIHIFSPTAEMINIKVNAAFSNIICDKNIHEIESINSVVAINSLSHEINDKCLGLFLTIITKIIGAFKSSSYSPKYGFGRSVRYHSTKLTKHNYLSTIEYPPIIMNTKEYPNKFENYGPESTLNKKLLHSWPPMDPNAPSALCLHLDNIDLKMYGGRKFASTNLQGVRDYWEQERAKFVEITNLICEYTNWEKIPTHTTPQRSSDGGIEGKLWDIWNDKNNFRMFKMDLNNKIKEGETNDFIQCDNYNSTWMGNNIHTLLRILDFFECTYDNMKILANLSQPYGHAVIMDKKIKKEVKQFCGNDGCDFNILDVRLFHFVSEIKNYLGNVVDFFNDNNVNGSDGRDKFLFQRYAIRTLDESRSKEVDE